MRCHRLSVASAFLANVLLVTSPAVAELAILDKPLWIFPGQMFRIALEQPASSGRLKASVPPTVELFDTWDKDTIQRFYFRSLSPGDATLKFQGKAGEIEIALEVIPWSDAYKPRKYKNIALPRIWPTDDPGYRHLKQRRTFHAQEEFEQMRKPNAKVSEPAAGWVKMSDEEIWNVIPGPAVPRTCLIVLGGGGREDGRGKGCPVCQMKIYEGRSAFYPWIFDAENHPWKVGCPSCKTWFPSNDWHKGDMHSGPFPDDGFGCEPVEPVMAPNGVPWRWPFVAYYHQWTAYMNTFTPGIEASARAYAQTGDRRYAHKAAVGLFRYAQSMIDMSMNVAHRKMAYRDAILRWPVGAPSPRNSLQRTFLYIQPNWDTPRMEGMARAWDLIFDTVDDDRELLDFCRARHHPEIESADDLRRFIETGVIRVPLQACLDNAVARNYPMQEVTVATMALIMDSPRAVDLADWLLNDGAAMRFALSNEFFKDGSGPESESYNSIHIRDIDRVFNLLERIRQLYPEQWEQRGLVSPYDDPKYRLTYDFPIANSLIGRTATWTGDTAHSTRTAPRKPLSQTYPLSKSDYVDVYRRTRDPCFAQILFGDGRKIDSALNEPDLRAEVEKIGKTLGGEVRQTSRILDGYGHVILHSGAGEDQRAFWLRYGRIRQHAHQDLLSIGLAALRRDMLPEMGYPQGWTYASKWAANWGTHYGTHVTGVPTAGFGRGALTLFADTAPAKVATATTKFLSADHEAVRSRTIVLVDLSDRDCYALTLERVLGGQEHTMSFHGPDGDVAVRGLQLEDQPEGTVLGAGVPYGEFTGAADGELSCLAFMYDVRRATSEGAWSLDYSLRAQDNVHLYATMLTAPGLQVALAKGKPPQGNKTYEITWSIVSRQGPAPLTSQFLTVLEPFEGDRIVKRIEPVVISGGTGPFAPVGVRVTSREFVDTIILGTADSGPTGTADGLNLDGEFGFWRERNGKPVRAVLVGGKSLGRNGVSVALSAAAVVGRIKSCDWPGRTLIVEPAVPDPAAMVGRHLCISNRAGNSASYLVEAAEPIDGGTQITLPLDARVGEGFVTGCDEQTVTSSTHLKFHGYWGYYAGKTIANEDNTASYRLADVKSGTKCVIDVATHQTVAAKTLQAQFVDKNGDGRACFAIYDYGPDDEVVIKNSTVVSPNE